MLFKRGISLAKGSIFFLTNHGNAGDLIFDWIPKILKLHPEIFVYLGESVRSKYFRERSRKERPPIDLFKEFLMDLAADVYQLSGDCFSYRTYHFDNLPKTFFNSVKVVNITRDPYVWLEHYVSWRKSNLNMPRSNSFSLDHEWSVTKHDYFSSLGLRKYLKEEVNIWSFYQGLDILSRMKSDFDSDIEHFKAEDLVKDMKFVNKLLEKLGFQKLSFDVSQWPLMLQCLKPSRKNQCLILEGKEIHSKWKQWQFEAYEKILKQDSRNTFLKHGYELI